VVKKISVIRAIRGSREFQSNAQGGKKNSNIFEYFYIVFEYFISVFEYFRTFSNVFERFLHGLARLVRKSALLIEILTHLRINLRIWFENLHF